MIGPEAGELAAIGGRPSEGVDSGPVDIRILILILIKYLLRSYLVLILLMSCMSCNLRQLSDFGQARAFPGVA